MSSTDFNENKTLPAFVKRNRSAGLVRKYFNEQHLEEVITPVLVSSAALEPYLDSFDVRGFPYCLPTSPEFSLKKQLALGYARSAGIYEIAHAFRNENLSTQHSHEFIMVEWYRNGGSYLDLRSDVKNITDLLIENFAPPVDENNPGNPAKPSGRITDNASRNKPVTLSVRELFTETFELNIEPDWNYSRYCEAARQIQNKKLPFNPPSGLKEGAYVKNMNNESRSAAENAGLIELFSLLYDSAINEYCKKNAGLVFVADFPEFVRAMSKISGEGWAQRMEAIYNGVEIANGYQEMSDSKELETIWNQNNSIRRYYGKEEHPVDEVLVALSPEINATGMALGLERTLFAIGAVGGLSQFSEGFFSRRLG